MVKVDFD